MKNDLQTQGFGAIKVEKSSIGAAKNYINGHNLLPSSYPHMTDKEIGQAIDDLNGDNCSIKKSMTAIMILAHAGTKPAHQTLLDFHEKTNDKQLKIWAKIAIDEFEMWFDK